MVLTLNLKVYQIKNVLEIDLHDIRKNTNPLFKIFDPKYGHVEFFQNLLVKVPVASRIFYHHFWFNFLWRFFRISKISRS